MGDYDTAVVCTNGHVINNTAESFPESTTKFCGRCGAVAVTACDRCRTAVRGEYHSPGIVVISAAEPKPPAYCHGCGEPLPWTRARLQALKDLVAESKASADEGQKLAESLASLASDTPGTQVAVMRWKKFLAGTGKDLLSFARKLVEEVASEAVKRQLFGP